MSASELTKAKNQKLAAVVHPESNRGEQSAPWARRPSPSAIWSTSIVSLAKFARSPSPTCAGWPTTCAKPERALTVVVERNLLGSLMGRKSGPGNSEENSPITAKPETGAAPPAKPGLRRPADDPAKPPVAAVLESRLKLPNTRYVLPNGLRVIVVPNHEVPYVNVQLGFENGAWTESKPGTASLAMSMLTRGTSKHSEKELAEDLDTYAIELGGSATMDSVRVDVGCLTEHLDRAMGFMREVVREPKFPADEFEKLRKQTRASLAVAAADASFKAERELRRTLYGTHPYARLATGEAKDVDALSVEDCKAWWKDFFRPRQAVLIFAGDITAERALALAEKTFGDWHVDGAAPQPAATATPAGNLERKIYLIDQPGAVQSQIRVGQLGILRSHPGYAAATVASSYFGGAFNSRLNETIRVKKGLTYGARGGYGYQRFGGSFVASTFSKTESTALALQAVLDEIQRFLSEKPTDKELADTKSYFVGSFASDRETPQQIATELWMLELNKLPVDFFEQTLERVGKADAEACTKLAQQTLDPKHMVIVVVGNAAKIKADLEKDCTGGAGCRSAARREKGSGGNEGEINCLAAPRSEAPGALARYAARLNEGRTLCCDKCGLCWR